MQTPSKQQNGEKATAAIQTPSQQRSTEQPIASVAIPRKQHYAKIPGQVLFRTDQNGHPVISGNLTNIKQGDAGDCYFLASLLAVAQRSQETIKMLVHDNGDDTYSGVFYGRLDGTHGNFQATVNGDLPENGRGKLVNNWIENVNGKAVSWAAIIEKLWAAVNGNDYAGIDGLGQSDANDHDIRNGLYAITGKVPVERQLASLTFAQMQQDWDQGAIVIGTAAKSGLLTGDHALAVLGVDATTQTITLGDPEGGTSTINFQDLTHSNANQYLTVQLPRS